MPNDSPTFVPGPLRGAALIAGLAGAVVASACGIAEPIEDRLVGVVYEQDGVPAVVVPEEAGVAQPFEVTVRTVGGACIRKGETEVEVDGQTATVTPYDRYAIPRPGLGCLPAASTIEHTVLVTFEGAGDATVVVRAREEGSDQIRQLDYPVVVAP
jgi:hypothetical protein